MPDKFIPQVHQYSTVRACPVVSLRRGGECEPLPPCCLSPVALRFNPCAPPARSLMGLRPIRFKTGSTSDHLRDVPTSPHFRSASMTGQYPGGTGDAFLAARPHIERLPHPNCRSSRRFHLARRRKTFCFRQRASSFNKRESGCGAGTGHSSLRDRHPGARDVAASRGRGGGTEALYSTRVPGDCETGGRLVYRSVSATRHCG